jgi:phosphoglycolate phosphatase
MTTQQKFPAAILFDWDGTLVDTLPFLFSAHNHVRGQIGEPLWTMEEYKNIIHYSARELYFKLYGSKEKQAIDILYKYVGENHLEALKIYDHSLTLLQAIKAHNIPCGIVSNKRHEYLNKEIDALDLREYSSVCIGAGYAAKDKPAADPILKALDEMGLKPSMDVWYVGDSETDMKAATAAVCAPILVRHHHDNTHLIETYAPRHVFEDCEAMRLFLSKNVETCEEAR